MKIYLAAIYSNWYLADYDVKINNTFSSYYYHRTEAGLKKLFDARKVTTGWLVCDSGAHTFFAEEPEKGCGASIVVKKTRTQQSPDDYFENYLAFLKNVDHILDYYVELDIGEIVGQDKVEDWRERLRREGLFHKCITCYHPSIMTLDDYRKMCIESESKYVAVEGDRPYQRTGMLDYTTIIKIGREHGCKVHGFAMTKMDALLVYPFYSVDSTSWNSVIVYGRSTSRQMSRQMRVIERHLGMEGYSGRAHMLKKEIKEFHRLEDYLTRLWVSRGVVWTE